MNESVEVGLPAYVLKLYVTHVTSVHTAYVERIRQWCSVRSVPLDLTIINILEQPDRAIHSRIFAAPTLVRESPSPSLRVVGNLDDTDRIMRFLQMPGAE